jgi:hypothetical protein
MTEKSNARNMHGWTAFADRGVSQRGSFDRHQLGTRKQSRCGCSLRVADYLILISRGCSGFLTSLPP